MSVRIRFVLMLTMVISIILLCSLFIIYTLYAHAREQEFNKRLWAQAYNEYKTYYNITDNDSAQLKKIDYYLPGAPINFQSFLLDGAYHLIAAVPKKINFQVGTNQLQTIKELGESDFYVGSLQAVGLYLNKQGHEVYSIAAGYDKYGLARLSSLRAIMTFVAAGSIVFIGLFALLYVIIVTRPLVDLSVQMRRISETNLTQRVNVGKGNVKSNEIVQIASNFNNMLDRLEKAFQLQKNFVHHASHELRTPLATMMAQTESALRRELSVADAKKVLESLKEDQQEMIDLTNSLLLLSQYENVSYSPNWPFVRIDELIYDSIGESQKMIPGITISFNFITPPENESQLALHGNETLLRSAIRNLIKNAYKYSDNKQVTITMETHPNSIELHFENDGQLINQGDAERLFLPFFRGDNSHQQKGFGLGLSIVKRIVELHLGIVTYSVVNDNMNRFTLRFSKP